VPDTVPSVVATLMWGCMYGPDFGPIAQVTTALGLGPPPFFSPKEMLLSIPSTRPGSIRDVSTASAA
jgi:multiple sugar transport system permease protein